MLLKWGLITRSVCVWGGGGGEEDTLSVTCPQGAKYAGGGGDTL